VKEPTAQLDPVNSLRADNVSVSYGAVRALEHVSLEIRQGEIHSLCGENGAGKSTLIRCLGGAMRPTSGRVVLGNTTLPTSVRAAEAAGVAVIHQEPLAFPDLSAADTVFMAREPTHLAGFWLDRRRMTTHADELLASLGERIDTRRPVGTLPLAQRQMVAIARGLAAQCRFLILDEPTASLSSREADSLHRLMRTLASQGVGVLLVSHRLDEVLSLSQRVTVLRDGRYVCTRDVSNTPNNPALSRDELVRLMVGRDVSSESPLPAQRVGDVRLRVETLGRRGSFDDVTLHVHAGEIVGMAGLIGAGRSEVARTIAGVELADKGHVHVDGRLLRPGRVREAIKAGLVMVPEERREQGLILAMSITSNIGMADPPGLIRRGFLSRRTERRIAMDSVSRLAIKARDIDSPCGTLSGGNQQKVLLSKWLAHQPTVLILDEPTRGVDVGAKSEIHSLIRGLADHGTAVLLISSDLPELLGLSHRVLVMREGRLAGELPSAEATPESVLRLAIPDAATVQSGAAP